MSIIQFKRGRAAWWTAINPVLKLGQPGYERDTGKFKIGDGVTAWNSLAYAASTVAEINALITAAVSAGFGVGSVGVIETVDLRACNSQTTIITANRCTFVRLPPHVPRRTVSQIRCGVVATSGNISMAVYSNTGTGEAAAPSTRQATTGAIACPAAGSTTWQNLSSSLSVGPGDWLALSCDNTTATFMRPNPSVNVVPNGRVMKLDTAHPAPASPSGTTTVPNAYWLEVN